MSYTGPAIEDYVALNGLASLHAGATTDRRPMMAAAATNGWIVTDGLLSTANFTQMAATPTGPFYEPADGDPLDPLD